MTNSASVPPTAPSARNNGELISSPMMPPGASGSSAGRLCRRADSSAEHAEQQDPEADPALPCEALDQFDLATLDQVRAQPPVAADHARLRTDTTHR